MKIALAWICLTASFAGGMPAALAATPDALATATLASETNTNATANIRDARLRLNFRNAPLDTVLEYLSEAAGFVINKESTLRGSVDVWSHEPITAEEAVALLNSVLRKNGYAVTRNGRILTVIELDNAKTADLEVVVGGDPEEVSKSEEVVTQVIPVRYANVAQLVNNLQVLLPASATLSANESANSLILVSTRSHIKRMLKVVKALDTALAKVSSVRVFPLRYADAQQVAAVVQQLFAPQATAGQRGDNAGNPAFTFGPGGFPGGPGGFPGGPGAAGDFGGPGGPGRQGRTGGTTAATGGGSAAGSRVVAVAEETSNSLVVSADSDVLPVIADLVSKIDVPVADVVELRLFRLQNADPNELADQLALVFPDESRSGGDRNQQNVRFGPGGFGGPAGGPFGGGFPGQTGGQAGTSERTRKQNRVVAVPDSRTSSLLVSATSALMPQIAEMIQRLDSNSARKEVVGIFELKNANPYQVNQILQDLFNRNSTLRNNANRDALAGQEDALANRQTQQQQLNQGGALGLGGRSVGQGGSAGGATEP